MNFNSEFDGRHPANDSPEDLTCSEGQVEDLLAGGESTEVDGEEEHTTPPPTKQERSSRKTGRNRPLDQRQK